MCSGRPPCSDAVLAFLKYRGVHGGDVANVTDRKPRVRDEREGAAKDALHDLERLAVMWVVRSEDPTRIRDHDRMDLEVAVGATGRGAVHGNLPGAPLAGVAGHRRLSRRTDGRASSAAIRSLAWHCCFSPRGGGRPRWPRYERRSTQSRPTGSLGHGCAPRTLRSRRRSTTSMPPVGPAPSSRTRQPRTGRRAWRLPHCTGGVRDAAALAVDERSTSRSSSTRSTTKWPPRRSFETSMTCSHQTVCS